MKRFFRTIYSRLTGRLSRWIGVFAAGLAGLSTAAAQPPGPGDPGGDGVWPAVWLIGGVLAGVALSALRQQIRRRREPPTDHCFRRLFEASPLGMAILDPETGRIREVNDFLAEILGIDRDQLVGRTFADLAHPDDAGTALPERGSGTSIPGRSLRLMTGDGAIRWVNVLGCSLAGDRYGSPVCLAIVDDVTDQREAAAALRRRETCLTALHQTALGIMGRHQLDDLLEQISRNAANLVDASDAFIYLHDPETDELVIRFGTGAYRSRLMGFRLASGEGLSGKVWQTGKPLSVNDYSTWPGRSTVPQYDDLHAVIAVPIKSEGRMAGVIGVARFANPTPFGPEAADLMARFGELASIAYDNAQLYSSFRQELAERQRAEAALADSEQRFKHLYHNAQVGLFRSRIEDGRIIEANLLCARIAGYDDLDTFLAEFITTSRYVFPQARRRILDRMRRYGEVSNVEAQIQRRDGEARWLSISGRIYPEAGFIEGAVLDITDRKAAQEALHRSEERLALIIQGSSVATFVIDPDHYVIHWNVACETLTGIPAHELIGTDRHWSAFHDTPRPLLADLVMTETPLSRIRDQHPGDCRQSPVVAGAREAETFYPNLGEAGKWLLITAAPLKDAAGEIVGAIETLQDVTESKNTEAALRRSRHRLRQIIDLVPHFIFAKDEGGRFILANQAVADAFGTTVDALIGRTDADFSTDPEIHGAFEKDDRKVMETGSVRVIPEETIINARGERRLLNTIKIPFMTDETEGPAVLGVSIDITAQKEVEAALRRSKRELSVQNRIATIFLTAPDNRIHDQVLEGVLDALESPMGYFAAMSDNGVLTPLAVSSPAPCAGDTDGEAFARHGTAGVPGRSLAQARSAAGSVERNFPADHPPVETALAVPIAHHGEPIGQFVVANRTDGYGDGEIRLLETLASRVAPVLQARLDRVRYAQERRLAQEEKARLEEQIRQAQKLEAIGALAGGIAHDFNNILFPILGFVEMTLEELPEGGNSRRYLQEVLKAANRARDLVQQILTFSRQAEGERKPVRIQLILKEVLKLIRSTLPATINIQRRIDNECGPVLADPTQIHQIAMNLITNAYHAMQETGGNLEVGLAEHDLSDQEMTAPDQIPGRYVRMTVSDTGPGMEKSVLEKIFEPYFTTKEKGKGTGLGLSVVHGIIRSCGGDISVRSTPGEGTVFNVDLPLLTDVERETPAPPERPVVTGSERILFVDDEEVITDMLSQMLRKMGYQVTARMSSGDALETFRADPDQFDLVITDMSMPRMTGAELSRRLLSIRPDLPIIICTGFSDQIDETKARAMGIREFVLKPVLKEDLARAIRDALDAPAPAATQTDTAPAES